MALFGTSAEDRLIAAISAHQGAIRLEHCVGSVKNIFKKHAVFNGYTSSVSLRSPTSPRGGRLKRGVILNT